MACNSHEARYWLNQHMRKKKCKKEKRKHVGSEHGLIIGEWMTTDEWKWMNVRSYMDVFCPEWTAMHPLWNLILISLDLNLLSIGTETNIPSINTPLQLKKQHLSCGNSGMYRFVSVHANKGNRQKLIPIIMGNMGTWRCRKNSVQGISVVEKPHGM